MPPPLPSAVLVAAWLLAFLAALFGPLLTHPGDPGDQQVRQTVRVALGCYFLAGGLMLWGKQGRLARLAWTLGWVAYLVHVALAFHHAFGWSHAVAVEHTRQRSGVGEGIYVSHLFTLVWTADVLWGRLSPLTHFHRPAWINWTLHGFMAFMVFNATVVYETGVIRWAALTAFAFLAFVAWERFRKGS